MNQVLVGFDWIDRGPSERERGNEKGGELLCCWRRGGRGTAGDGAPPQSPLAASDIQCLCSSPPRPRSHIPLSSSRLLLLLPLELHCVCASHTNKTRSLLDPARCLQVRFIFWGGGGLFGCKSSRWLFAPLRPARLPPALPPLRSPRTRAPGQGAYECPRATFETLDRPRDARRRRVFCGRGKVANPKASFF